MSDIITLMYARGNAMGYHGETKDTAEDHRKRKSAPLVTVNILAGLSPAELKRRYDAHDALVAALIHISQPADAGCGCSFPCRCNTPEAEEINADAMRDIASSALATAGVK